MTFCHIGIYVSRLLCVTGFGRAEFPELLITVLEVAEVLKIVLLCYFLAYLRVNAL